MQEVLIFAYDAMLIVQISQDLKFSKHSLVAINRKAYFNNMSFL